MSPKKVAALSALVAQCLIVTLAAVPSAEAAGNGLSATATQVIVRDNGVIHVGDLRDEGRDNGVIHVGDEHDSGRDNGVIHVGDEHDTGRDNGVIHVGD